MRVRLRSRRFVDSLSQTFVYPGFKEDELTPLPAQLESPQVLVHVSNSQSFKVFAQISLRGILINLVCAYLVWV